MSVKLNVDAVKNGTRFLIFPQPRFLKGFSKPEVVWIAAPPGTIKVGPEDDRMKVVDAIKKLHYNGTAPPYKGATNPKVIPGPGGHFDHLPINSREFLCAGTYAVVRRVLDIWEDYFGGTIPWHFAADFEKLEIIPFVEWNNSHAGHGFLEYGYERNENGGLDHSHPYCENFDVLAHELGHNIIFSKVGIPTNPLDDRIDYDAMHESAADLVSVIALLHFTSVVKLLLKNTNGNLFTANELGRIGELATSDQLSDAFNDLKMSVREEPHRRSLPLTGAIFDILVEVFQKNLVKEGLITQDLADRSNHDPGEPQDLESIAKDFKSSFKGKEKKFEMALLDARDYLGHLLAWVWSNLDKDFLKFKNILDALFEADKIISNGEHQDTIRDCFKWREILP
ncbi:MAG: hypothetical protein ABIN89_00820 [Chitinophagaceae bacterium]